MSQIVVDPRDLGFLSQSTPFSPVPPGARAFGYVPDLRACLPGDLVLLRKIEPDIFGKSIAKAQGEFSPDDARWTHAAVYLYDDLIVEAVPFGGVKTRSLYTDVPNRVLRVRRRRDLISDDRYKIALRALSMLGHRYSYLAALMIGWRSGLSHWDRLGIANVGPVIICSKVFHDAFVEITRSLLQGCSIDRPVTPAHLSATADLDDVAIGWVRLT